MAVIVYVTFELKQNKFKEGIENLQEMKKYRNENYNHKVEILTPISGRDHTYAIIATYDGLAEVELQNKKMFDDDEYLKIVGQFFLENTIQGSLNTQFFRTMSDVVEPKGKKQ